MYTTYHKSLTSLLKTIKAEGLTQYSVLLEDKQTEVDGKVITTQEYALARPVVEIEENV